MIGAFGAGAAIFMIVWRDVHFAADDGFYAMGGGLMIEICGGEEIAVVGYGDCGHAAAGGFCGEFADFAGAVQQRVVRVQMKVNEVRGIHAKFILNQLEVASNSNLRWFFSPRRRGAAVLAGREKQIPRCVPRPPNFGGKEKARDYVRDDTWFLFSAKCHALPDANQECAFVLRGWALAARFFCWAHFRFLSGAGGLVIVRGFIVFGLRLGADCCCGGLSGLPSCGWGFAGGRGFSVACSSGCRFATG